MEGEFDYVRSFSRSSEQVPALALRTIGDRLVGTNFRIGPLYQCIRAIGMRYTLLFTG